MEVELIQMEHDCNFIEKRSLEQLCPPDSPDIRDVFGDPLLDPRVGDEFQVEIPPMITESEHFQLLKSPADSAVKVDASHSFLMGLPIPFMWVRIEGNDIEGDRLGFISNHNDVVNANGVKSRNSTKNHSNVKKKVSKLNVETLDHGKGLRQENLGPKVVEKANFDQLYKRKSYCPVPGSSNESWSDAEEDSFLLALYIFGKNFFEVKKFMENKKMEEILSFYYGKFYRSDGHRRWSDCRKKRIRKSANGRKIFEGWRHQELLSRLLPHVPEELQNSMLEVSRKFAEEKTSLEEYVSFLKTLVSNRILVEAVSIGKGKEDLTGHAMEPTKTNQVFPVYPEIPIGKACSSLTSGSIMNYLTGGFRLSKARSNDIFWEAVWPRLLAKGWHSEQTRNQGYVGSNHDLVFLVAGVDKFSRRKLVKGEHYFDSISDVLSKVVSEPKLLELETEEARVGICTEQNTRVPEEKSYQDDLSNHERHCYLKPRVPTCKLNPVKFTVVDTSLSHEGKSPKMRELRDIPVTSQVTSLSRKTKGNYFKDSLEKYEVDPTDLPPNGGKNIHNANGSEGIFVSDDPNHMRFTLVDTSLVQGGKSTELREVRSLPVYLTSKLTSHSKEIKGNSSGDSLAEHKPLAADKPLYGEKNINNANRECMYEDVGSEPKAMINNSDTASKMLEGDQDQRVNTSDDKQSKMIIKHQFSRRAKSCQSDHSAPLIKRRKLTACDKAETSRAIESFSAGFGSEQVEPLRLLKSLDGSKKAGPQVSPKQKVSSIGSSTKSSPKEESSVCILRGNCFGTDNSHQKNEEHQFRPWIDLNLPQVPLDIEYCVPPTMEVEQSQMNTNEDGSCFPSTTNKLVKEPEALGNVGNAEQEQRQQQQPNQNARRQSTRNRPLTTKALEAFASGFLDRKRGQKNKVPTQENSFPKPSRRTRSRVPVNSNCSSSSTGIVDSKEEQDLDGNCNGESDNVSQPLMQNGDKWLTSY